MIWNLITRQLMLVVRSTVENLNVFQVLSYPVRKTAVNDSEYILPLSVIDSDSSVRDLLCL